jgi:hypothetical protein
MWQSATMTARSSVELVAVTDADDPSPYGSALDALPAPIMVPIAESRTHSDLWNVAYEYCSGDIVMLCADDLIFRSPGWDVAVAAEFAEVSDGILHCWCNDGTPHTEIATHPFVSRRWVEAAGTFTPPYYEQWYADTWLLCLALLVERSVYLSDVLIEHQHVQYGTAPDDETYRRGAEKRPASQEAWSSRIGERLAQAERLVAAMRSPARFVPPFEETWEKWNLPS